MADYRLYTKVDAINGESTLSGHKKHNQRFADIQSWFPVTTSAAQYEALLLDAAKTGYTFTPVLRSDVPLEHDDGNGTSGQVLQSDGDGTVSWLTFSGLTDGDKTDITVSSTGSVWTIDNDAITTVKILDANVTAAKLATDSVETAKILNDNVTTAKIADANITTAKIADKAVDQDKIAFTYLTKTTTYTAVDRDYILADTSSAAWTLTLPATPSAGDFVVVVDSQGTFDSNNLTLGRNSSPIESVAADLTIDIKNFVGRYEYLDATIGWKRVG